jgi:hypothetical protein
MVWAPSFSSVALRELQFRGLDAPMLSREPVQRSRSHIVLTSIRFFVTRTRIRVSEWEYGDLILRVVGLMVQSACFAVSKSLLDGPGDVR